MASVWWQLRKRSERPRAQRLPQIDSHIRQIAKAVQDLFEAVDELFSIYSRAYERLNASGLHAQSVRFGHAVVLSEAEWSAVSHALSEMTKQYSLVRIHCMSLQRLLPLSSLPGEENIRENLEGLKDGLNDVLFESATFEEAMLKLHPLKARVDAFLREIRALTNL